MRKDISFQDTQSKIKKYISYVARIIFELHFIVKQLFLLKIPTTIQIVIIPLYILKKNYPNHHLTIIEVGPQHAFNSGFICCKHHMQDVIVLFLC